MSNNTKLLIIFIFLGLIIGSCFYLIKSAPSEKVNENTQVTASPNVFPTMTASSSAALGVNQERAKVVKVVDGDTIKLETGETVRLIGIDTPETVDPRRPVGCFGKQASNEAKKLLEGKEVVLEKDVSDTDKYQRLLRYVYLPLDGENLLFVNDYLVREGFGKTLTYPPDVKFNEQFLEAQRQARENRRGLWGAC